MLCRSHALIGTGGGNSVLQPNGERKEMDDFDEAPDYAPDPVDADADDRSGSFSVILGFRVNTL